MSAQPEVITLGETMALLCSPRVGPLRHAYSLDLSCGGAESNMAIGLSRLGHRVAWVGRVGDDEFGALVRRTLAAEGIDTRAVVVDPAAATGLMVKSRRTNPDLMRSARVLHLTGITPALSASARAAVRYAADVARAAGVTISLDLNYRQALWTAEEAGAELAELVRAADVVFATEPEARLVVAGDDPDALAFGLAKLGPREVLLKRGALGAVAVAGDALVRVAPYDVVEVDPVGAGDAFAAGYLSGLLDGDQVADRLARAALAGAFAVTVSGDWEGLPDRAELAALAAQNQSNDAVHR